MERGKVIEVIFDELRKALEKHPDYIKHERMIKKDIIRITAILITIIILVLRPFILIRFKVLKTKRIGHLAWEPEMYLCERDIGLHGGRYLDIFYRQKDISNNQLTKMWEKVLIVFPFPEILWFMSAKGWIVRDKRHQIKSYYNDNYNSSLTRTKTHLKFTDDEIKLGQRQLEMMGVPPGASYICIYGRDNSYLNTTYPVATWAHHNCRNSAIDNYLKAAEKLTEYGHYVIRMGHIVEKSFNTNNPKIIDYATNGHRTDFMDIYIAATCRFFLGNDSGLVSVPVIFRRPVAFVDWMIIENFYDWAAYGIVITKKLFLHCKQRQATYKELLQLARGDEGSQSAITKLVKSDRATLIDNTPDEIMYLAIEMEERINGTWIDNSIYNDLQDRFRSLYPINKKYLKDNRVRIGSHFINENRHLLGD